MGRGTSRLDTVQVKGQVVKELRRSRQLTQAQLALGLCHPGYLSDIERGVVERVGRPTAAGVAAKLGVPLVQILSQPASTVGLTPAPGAQPRIASLLRHGFPHPRNSASNEEALLDEVVSLLQTQELTERERAELLKDLTSFVGWQRYRYGLLP